MDAASTKLRRELLLGTEVERQAVDRKTLFRFDEHVSERADISRSFGERSRFRDERVELAPPFR